VRLSESNQANLGKQEYKSNQTCPLSKGDTAKDESESENETKFNLEAALSCNDNMQSVMQKYTAYQTTRRTTRLKRMTDTGGGQECIEEDHRYDELKNCARIVIRWT
jgi:hypothetical protein